VIACIDYAIPSEHQEPFRAAMAKLRQTRLRDGAFRWSLFQDLTTPPHFRESFLVGSWAEHLRQHDRATFEDKRIEESVIAFHQGIDPPRVNHFLMADVSEIHLPTTSDRERL
jgi:hypothetical protein